MVPENWETVQNPANTLKLFNCSMWPACPRESKINPNGAHHDWCYFPMRLLSVENSLSLCFFARCCTCQSKTTSLKWYPCSVILRQNMTHIFDAWESRKINSSEAAAVILNLNVTQDNESEWKVPTWEKYNNKSILEKEKTSVLQFVFWGTLLH